MFYKLKRTSQTSLEGVHELAVTFITPRLWQGIVLQVECSAVGQRKVLWVKQSSVLGHAKRYVQLIPAANPPIRQTVFKPAGRETAEAVGATVMTGQKQFSPAAGSAASPTKWRATRTVPVTVRIGNQLATPSPAPPAVNAEDSAHRTWRRRKRAGRPTPKVRTDGLVHCQR